MSQNDENNLFYTPVEDEQPMLVDMSDWRREWQDMPEFEHDELEAYHTVIIRVKCEKDLKDLARKLEQPLTKAKTATSIWYPKAKPAGVTVDSSRVWIDEDES